MTRFYHSTRHSGGPKKAPLKSFFITPAIFFLAGLFIVSCEEDPTIIGKELLPATDFVSIQSTDTIRPQSFTMYDDSISTENPSASYLGEIWDPYFGTTTAGFVSQLRLKEDWDGKAWTADSMRLMLQLSVNGGKNGTHTLSIDEIAKDLNTSEKYYSTTKVPLANFHMDIPLPDMPSDSTSFISIKLADMKLADRLLEDTSKLFHSNKVPDFRSYFKGLYFKLTSTGDPMMTFLSLAHTGSQEGTFIIDKYYSNYFVIYLHDGSGNKKEYYFILDAVNRNASFSVLTHDFTTAEPGKRIQHYNNLSYRDSLTYLQSLNGVYTRMTLPGLESLKKTGNFHTIAINKARLSIPYDTSKNFYTPSTLPSQLFIRYRAKDGTRHFLSDNNINYDASYDYSTFLDGLIDSTQGVYHFNIPGFVQDYFQDETGNILPELELYVKRGTKNGILNANDSKRPPKFDFTYSRF
jgi:hypothetical protein